MESVAVLKRRIKTTQSTQNITRAMQLVSALRLRKVEALFLARKPFAGALEDLAANLALAARETDDDYPLFADRPVRNVGLVVVTSTRGLCGTYNFTLLREAEKFLRRRDKDRVRLFLVGKKGVDYFSRRDWPIALANLTIGSDILHPDVETLADKIIDSFLKQEVDEVYLLYTGFAANTYFKPQLTRFLNIAPAQTPDGDYIFEPGYARIRDRLIPEYLKNRLYVALAEAFTAEHSARMWAMKNASDNAEDIIHDLQLFRNKLRQATITREISEIVSGADSLQHAA